jgi:tetratricopeptide (TPR) repeat protein
MILPLRSTRDVWTIDWFDLDVPVQFGELFILPTCLYIVQRDSRMLIGHEFVRELDQRRVEMFMHRLFEERGAPDELLIPDREEWDEQVWQALSREYDCHINLIDIEESEDSVESDAEVESQLNNLIAGSAGNVIAAYGPSFVAQGLVRAVKHTRSREKKRANLSKALELQPEFPDALLELADLDLQEGNLEQAMEGFEKAARGAEPLHVPGQPGIYTRALYGSLLAAWHQGDLTSAVAIAEESLSVNPMDHHGIRFLLPLFYLMLHQSEAAAEFYARYQKAFPDDLEDPGFLFGWGLSLFEADDESGAATKLQAAMLQNIYIAPLLLDLPEPSPDLWQHHDRGELSYALEFVDSFGSLWERDAAAARFLRETYTEMLPRLQRLIEIRSRMAEIQDQRYEPDHKRIWEELLAAERRVTGV